MLPRMSFKQRKKHENPIVGLCVTDTNTLFSSIPTKSSSLLVNSVPNYAMDFLANGPSSLLPSLHSLTQWRCIRIAAKEKFNEPWPFQIPTSFCRDSHPQVKLRNHSGSENLWLPHLSYMLLHLDLVFQSNQQRNLNIGLSQSAG